MKNYFSLWVVLYGALLPACTQQLDIIEREQRRLRSETTNVATEATAIRAELDSFRGHLADTRANVQQMQQELNALRERVEEVRYLLDRQVSRTTREGDLKVKGMESRLIKLEEELKSQSEQLKAREEELKILKESKAAEEEVQKERAVAESPAVKKDYDEAWKSLDRKEYRTAIGRFRDFLKKHPKSSLADNAQYWIGECYYALKEFDQAILAFDEVDRKYPSGDKVPAALLKQGFAYAELAKRDARFRLEARLVLQKLIDKHPASEEAAKAKQKLKILES